MSKRELKKFLNQLPKSELEAQIVALYDKFIPVKTYFDFVFNPKEDQLVNDAKVKISLEFYPLDLMLYAIEIAQTYTDQKTINSELFFKSMLGSYEQAIRFMIEKGILNEFQNRVEAIKEETIRQDWFNQYEFIAITERFEY